ncbi:MAG: hypothetical protein FWE47_03315 [Oscillospiraceae bacterium]|nr:hypothetical protein [Oscillospiraceae bacterium]
MRKIYSLLLVTIMAVSLSACGGNSSGGNTLAILDWMKEGTYHFKYQAEMEVEGEIIATKGWMASNGKAIASQSEYVMDGETMIMRLLEKDDMLYIINDVAKTITKFSSDLGDTSQDVRDFSNMEFVKSGTAHLKGKSYAYDEYIEDGSVVRFYKEGNNLYAIETISPEVTTLMIIDSYSKNAPAGSFDLPSGYSEFSF